MFIDSTKKNYDSHLKKFCDFFHVSFNKSEGISRNLLVDDCFSKYFEFLRLSNVSVSLLLFVPSLTHSTHFNLCSLRHTILRKQLLIQSFSFIIWESWVKDAQIIIKLVWNFKWVELFVIFSKIFIAIFVEISNK
jgi:hypothetical protein